MSVYLYPGGFRLVHKSGVGQALLHQQKALTAAGIPLAQTMRKGEIVHINTVFPDSLLAALAARLSGKKSSTTRTQRWRISAAPSPDQTGSPRCSKGGSSYLTTPSRFRQDLDRILAVPGEIRARCGDDGVPLHDPAQGDYERGNYRGFVCYAADLLKYVYFFSAVRALMRMLDDPGTQPPALRYEIYIHEGDEGLLALYPDCLDLEGLNIYVYQPKEDPAGH